MIFHYLKIAFRNYLNNKIQSVITLFSMAIAFALASIAAYWIHYEKNYDSFLKDYDRIYRIALKHPDNSFNGTSFWGLHSHLMNNFAEVDKACGITSKWNDRRMVAINKQIIQAGCEAITPETIEMFDIQWVEGNRNMNSWKENEVAVSEQIARQTCGKNSPIGIKLALMDKDGIEIVNEYQIAAVFKTWPKHSNFNFHILKKYVPLPLSFHKVNSYSTYICLKPDTDIDLFLQKMMAKPFVNELGVIKSHNALVPLSKMHNTFLNKKRDIRLNDVKLFAGAAILLSVCALLNYLTLFVSRLRNRGRDMALRTICGSSAWQTGILLMVEYLLLLLGSLILSILFIELFYNGFIKLSQQEIDRATVYAGCGYLLLFILGLATVLSLVPILYFKNKTLRVQIDSTPPQLVKNRFHTAGVCMQLFISLFFIFCSTVMIKQIHYLVHADINIERKNIAWLSAPFREDVIMSTLKQIPSITEMVPTMTPIFPAQNIHPEEIQGFEGRENLMIIANEIRINQEVARFYGLNMKEGPKSFDLKQDEILINETFAKRLGDPNPIGKVFSPKLRKVVIKGVVHDFQYQDPTKPAPALYFSPELENKSKYLNTIAFKYSGDFTDCEAAIKKAFEKVEPDLDDPDALKIYNRLPLRVENGETVYNSYLTSEFNLLKLLSIITVISLLIALFGVYSQILQECKRQRKNIAIRKVFGAQVKDIMMMFFKEYIMQVALAATLAFPIGYVLIKKWLENFSRQSGIGIEVFLGIFFGMVLLVILCIGWHVWHAANENPATAVMKE